MAEDMTPEEVMAMLRAFHGRMEEQVFRHGGCLEKFIGDALLATFGVPEESPLLVIETTFFATGGLPAGWRSAVHRAEDFKYRFVTGR